MSPNRRLSRRRTPFMTIQSPSDVSEHDKLFNQCLASSLVPQAGSGIQPSLQLHVNAAALRCISGFGILVWSSGHGFLVSKLTL